MSRPCRPSEADSAPQSIVLADFNGDGHSDLALATQATDGGTSTNNLVVVQLGNGDGTFPMLRTFAVGNGPVSIASGRLRGPAALPDLFTANFGSNNMSVLINETATCMGKPATIVGTDGRDRLTGTKKADVIVGQAATTRSGPERATTPSAAGRVRICSPVAEVAMSYAEDAARTAFAATAALTGSMAERGRTLATAGRGRTACDAASRGACQR